MLANAISGPCYNTFSNEWHNNMLSIHQYRFVIQPKGQMTEWLKIYFYHLCTRSKFPLPSYLDLCLLYYSVLPHSAGSIWRIHSPFSARVAGQAVTKAGLPREQGTMFIWYAESILFSWELYLRHDSQLIMKPMGARSSFAFASLCPWGLSGGCTSPAIQSIVRNVFLQHFLFSVAKPRVKVSGRFYA